MEHNQPIQSGAETSLSGEQLAAFGETDHFKVQLLAESLDVQKRERRVGEVRIERRVIEEQIQVPVTLRREEIFLSRRKPDVAGAAGETASETPASTSEKAPFEEETLSFVLYEEIPIVSKFTQVREIVEIQKRLLTEEKTFTDIIRREEAAIDQGATGRVRIEQGS